MAKISLNVSEDVFSSIQEGKRNFIEVNKNKFVNRVDSYDEIELIKWGTVEAIYFRITNISVNPDTKRYTVCLRDQQLRKETINLNMLISGFFLISLVFCFLVNLQQREQIDTLETVRDELAVENIELHKKTKFCLCED